MAAFFIPIVTTDREIAQDAEEYAAWRERIATGEETPPDDTAVLLPTDAHAVLSPVGSAPPVQEQGKTGVDLAACFAANEDFIGWLQIPGTTVDYPVVQTDDVDYYLNHTFTGKKSYIGTLLSLDRTDFQAPSRNIAIYGHHIRSNDQVMFSPLLAYKERSFYNDHQTLYFDTLYYPGTYKVFAVINMHNGEWEPSTADFTNDDDFLAFVEQAKAQSLYDTGVAIQASDHILTLITCDRSYGGKNGRLVVMAVKQ